MEDDFDLDLYVKDQTNKVIKVKTDDKSRRLSNVIKILIIIAAFITAFELYSYASHLIEVWRDNRINETARSIAEQAARRMAVSPEGSAVHGKRGILSTESHVRNKMTVTSEPVLMPVILELRDAFLNNDIVAYLSIEGSNIGFPIVQTDNNSYYLTHDLRFQNNAAGSAFMDYESPLYPLGYNTVIYAHNMRDGSMFHNLRYYNDFDYFNEHKAISLQTLNEDTLWEIFSFYETNIEFLYNATSFYNARDFIEFANLLKEKSKYPADVYFTEDSKILTLSTCTNRDADSRYVLHAYRFR